MGQRQTNYLFLSAFSCDNTFILETIPFLVYGTLPGKGIHTTIEMYGQDRFTTITTNHLPGTPPTIEQRQEALDALYHRFAPAITETTNQNTRGGVWSGSTLTELPPE